MFGEQALHEATVEQIAAVAEASSAALLQYFPTREDVDTNALVESLGTLSPEIGPVTAVRMAVALALSSLPDNELSQFCSSATLGVSLPQSGEFARTTGMLAAALSRRAGRDQVDFTDQILAGAVIGAMTAALSGPGKPDADLPARFDAALAYLEAQFAGLT
jgi:AcrR family transcriptional regulator